MHDEEAIIDELWSRGYRSSRSNTVASARLPWKPYQKRRPTLDELN
jgi:hypothetical protein